MQVQTQRVLYAISMISFIVLNLTLYYAVHWPFALSFIISLMLAAALLILTPLFVNLWDRKCDKRVEQETLIANEL